MAGQHDDQWRAAAGGAVTGGLAGASLGPVGAGVGALVGGALGYFGTPKRPKYNVNPVTDENKALASGAAFGVNPSTRMGIAQAEQDAAEDVNTAQNYSANTGSILNVLRSVNSQKNATVRAYMGDNSNQQAIGRSQLIGANKDIVDEQDKAWNFNTNLPYQNAVAQNRETQRGGAENYWRLLDSIRARKLYQQGGNFSPNTGGGLPGYAYQDLGDGDLGMIG